MAERTTRAKLDECAEIFDAQGKFTERDWVREAADKLAAHEELLRRCATFLGGDFATPEKVALHRDLRTALGQGTERAKCERCDGTGKLTAEWSATEQEYVQPECDQCEGTGKVWTCVTEQADYREPCDLCGVKRTNRGASCSYGCPADDGRGAQTPGQRRT